MTTDDKGIMTSAQTPPTEAPDRPTPALAILTGLLLGGMLAWVIAVALYTPPPRYSGLRPEVLLIVVIGCVVGVILGGFAGVLFRGGSRRA